MLPLEVFATFHRRPAKISVFLSHSLSPYSICAVNDFVEKAHTDVLYDEANHKFSLVAW